MDDRRINFSVSAAERWAQLVIQASTSARPMQSLGDWADAARMSQRTLRNRCIAAGVRAKPSLDLARMLWAILRAETLRVPSIWDLMSEAGDTDPRTMVRLLRGAGLNRRDGVPRVQEFLCQQTFVAPGPSLRSLQRVLSSLNGCGSGPEFGSSLQDEPLRIG